MTDQSNRKDLSIRSATSERGAKARQLALLADSFAAPSALSLIATTLHDGSISTTAAGPALAKDVLLTQALRQAAVYQFAGDGHSPERDFVTLSTSNKTDQVTEALSRLASAFLEIRGTLVSTMKHAAMFGDPSGSEDVDNSQEESVKLIKETFATVNACYILVISTTHARFDESKQFRNDLSDVFQKLLQCDPFLKELAPSFETLKNAKSADARKVALRQFFETFCDEAQQPSLYDPAFSAVVQSMLLRELRQIVAEEAERPKSERVSTPYLAKLFESRLRGELDIVRSGEETPLAVLPALRRCPKELTAIMSTFTTYLLESSNSTEKTLTISDDEAIASEIMLSVGCLLPESGLADRLAGILRQAPDLNPALTLVFASAFKFALADPGAPSSDTGLLLERTLEILPGLNEKQRDRAFQEILLPLADDCVTRCIDRNDLWKAFPREVKAELIEKVIVRRISRHIESESPIDTAVDEAIIDLLYSHLAPQPAATASLHPVAMRWLVQQTLQGAGTPELAERLAQIVILQPEVATQIGCSDSDRDALLGRSGGLALQFLCENQKRHTLFVDQLARLKDADAKTAAAAHRYLKKIILVPLESALQRYDKLLTDVDNAELAKLSAQEKRKEKEGVEFQLQKLKAERDIVQSCLDENIKYLETLKAIENVDNRITKLKDEAADLAGLSTKQLFEKGKVGRPEEIKQRLKERLQERKALMDQKISLGTSLPTELKDRRQISLSEFEALEGTIQKLQEETAPRSTSEHAASQRQSHLEGDLAKIQQEVQRLFELANRAVATPIAKTLDPASVHFRAQGAGARLALVVRLHLLSHLLADGASPGSLTAALDLERDARSGLADAIRRFKGLEDTVEMLNVFAAMNRTGSRFLASWPEAVSAHDTDTAVDVRNIPSDCSFSEYLYQRLRSDVRNREGTWLTNEPGWDERFHAPILTIFSRTLERQDASKEAKARAQTAVFQGCCFWVKENLAFIERQKAASEEAHDTSDLSQVSIQVSMRELLAPWSALLHVSQGVGAKLKAQTEFVTRTLVAEVVRLLPTASQEEIDTLYLPLAKRVAKAVSRPDSALFQKNDLLDQYVNPLKARLATLKAARDREAQAVEQQLEKSIPEAPRVEGLDFEKFGTSSMQRNLPAPAERRQNGGLLGFNPDAGGS